MLVFIQNASFCNFSSDTFLKTTYGTVGGCYECGCPSFFSSVDTFFAFTVTESVHRKTFSVFFLSDSLD